MSINKTANKIELYPLGKDKDIIYKALMNNQDVYDLVMGENPSSDDVFQNHYFNTLIVDTTQLESKTYIAMDTTVSRADTQVKCLDIMLDVFCDLSIINLSTTEQIKFYTKGFFGNRVDALIDAVKRTISDLDIGIGMLTLRQNNPISIVQPVVEKYYGKRTVYQCFDF